MPKRNPPRSIDAEERLSRRIAAERTERGWSYASLAQRMADEGCPIQPTALYRIEKGSPRRTIYVDELVALAHVLQCSVADMLSEQTELAL